jgi:hypothetical protein
MNGHKIVPEKVTRPIQLLAAWLAGLIIVDGAFLTAATQINSLAWASGALIIASITNVPLFLVSLFLLQTKFRPEMQEDAYYSKYLEYQYSKKTSLTKTLDIESQVKHITKNILKELGPGQEMRREPIERILHTSQVEQIAIRIGGSRSLSELHKRPHLWANIVEHWKKNATFCDDVKMLINEGVISMNGEDYLSCKLTELGKQVVDYAEKNGIMFYQKKEYMDWWKSQGLLEVNR